LFLIASLHFEKDRQKLQDDLLKKEKLFAVTTGRRQAIAAHLTILPLVQITARN
jgi:hypothetical protein